MRISPLKTVFCVFCLLLILYSCGKEDPSVELLRRAQQMAENNPAEALQLLDSIPYPGEMRKDDYMQHIVAKVHAKYRGYHDVANDTLIFEAYKYFDNKNNAAQSALAHYYTAAVYHEKKLTYSALEHYLLARDYAIQAGNNLLAGKSYHSIGNFYNDRNLSDSALVSFKHALEYYEKEKGADSHRFEMMRMIGIIYYKIDDLDSASDYYNRGLKEASLLGNTDFQTTFEHLLGIVSIKKEEYAKAAGLLRNSFAKTTNEEELWRICYSLLKLYNEKTQLDSAGYYADLLKENLSKVTYSNSLRGSYKSLSEYYEKKGDYKEALYYNGLLRNAEKEFNESFNSRQLAEAHQKYESVMQKKEADRLKMRNNLLLACTVLVIILVVAIAYFRFKRIRQKATQESRLLEARLETKRIKLQAQEENVEQRNKSLGYMQSTYENIIHEWGEIDKKVKTLAAEYGATEEPELYVQIKSLIGNFKENTNLHLIALAKDYLQKQPYGEAALNTLQDRELLVFMLYYSGYKRKEVAVLLGVDPSKANMNIRKIGLKTKLIKVGMPKNEVEQILFSEDNKEGEEHA